MYWSCQVTSHPEAPQLTGMQWSFEANENRGLGSERLSYQHCGAHKGRHASKTKHTAEEPKEKTQNCPNTLPSSHCPTWGICYCHTCISSSRALRSVIWRTSPSWNINRRSQPQAIAPVHHSGLLCHETISHRKESLPCWDHMTGENSCSLTMETWRLQLVPGDSL